MQVIVHCGAHATEEDRLLKTLLRNKSVYSATRTAVPGPGKYRPLLRECFDAMDEEALLPDAKEALWDAILDEEDAQRVILSNPHFWGSPRMALTDNRLYPAAEQRMSLMQRLFQDDELQLHLTLRNPVGFIPALLHNASPQRIHELRHGCDPTQVRWSDLLIRLRQHVPSIPITVWCYEDLPLIWANVLRTMGGLEDGVRVHGGMDFLASVMTREGMQRLRGYLNSHSEMPEPHKRRVYAAFLDKYVLDEALEEELDMPEWNEALIDDATQIYEQDLEVIENLQGVTLLSA